MAVADNCAVGDSDQGCRGDTDLIGSALRTLQRAHETISAYPSEHPAVLRAVEEATTALSASLEQTDSFVLAISRDDFLVGGESIGEKLKALRPFAAMMHEIDLAWIEFQAGVTVSEVKALTACLGSARRQKVRGAQLVDMLGPKPLDHIRVVPIDYRAITFADASGDHDGRTSGAQIWQNLSQVLMDPGDHPENSSIEPLAEAATSEIRRTAGADGLRSTVDGIVRDMRSMDKDQRALSQQRLGGFIAALSPELRQDLMQVLPETTETSLGLMAEVASHVPCAELLEALKGVDVAGGRAPDEMLTLTNKLVRIARERPAESEGLGDLLERWGISKEVLSLDDDDLRDSLEEVFQRRVEEDYKPEGYTELLHNISKENLGPGDPTQADRYQQELTDPSIAIHAARIGVLSLDEEGGDTFHPGIYGFVGSNIERMLEDGRVDELRQAAAAAQRDIDEQVEEQGRLAAEGFLGEFARPECFEQILDQLCADPQLGPAALPLMRLAGSDALRRVAERLTAEASGASNGPLWQFLEQSPAEELGALLVERAGQGWAALAPLFPILEKITFDDALPVLVTLSERPELDVRSEAFGALYVRDKRPGSPERHLRRALADPHRRIETEAIERMGDLSGSASLDLLGKFIEGQLTEQEPMSYHCRLAAQTLSRRGDGGALQLCRTLRNLSGTWHPPLAHKARLVAETLKDHRHMPQVRRALRRWSYSRTRLITIFVKPRTRSAGEART
ncbi:MAG: hypothetical protein CMJ18_02715 [Phycisphaeraceae bacterium]|nr:hypothetical protein [Phycisphaeraceae bacterium]